MVMTIGPRKACHASIGNSRGEDGWPVTTRSRAPAENPVNFQTSPPPLDTSIHMSSELSLPQGRVILAQTMAHRSYSAAHSLPGPPLFGPVWTINVELLSILCSLSTRSKFPARLILKHLTHASPPLGLSPCSLRDLSDHGLGRLLSARRPT